MELGKKNRQGSTNMVQIIVTNQELQQIMQKVKKSYYVKYTLPMIDSVVIEVEKGLTEELFACECNKKEFMNVEMDSIIHAQMNRAINTLQLQEPRRQRILGEGVGVAVLDTGVYPHADLTFGKNRIIAFCDVVNGRRYPYDDNGHGTHA